MVEIGGTFMRIAHISATFPPYLGGTGNVCFYNARELARLGHQVHVFTTRMPGVPEMESIEGFSLRRLRPLVQVGNASLTPGLLWGLRGFDLLHLHYPFVPGAELVRLAAWMCRVPLVITYHNDLIGDRGRGKLFRLYQALSVRLTVRGASKLCVLSMDHYRSSVLYRSLDGKGPQVVEVPDGVDSDHFCPEGDSEVRKGYRIPEEAKLILFVAALDRAHHFKRLDLLLQALDRLPDDCWLLVVGDGDMHHTFEEQAASLGIAGRTVFAGRIDHHDLPSFYRCADLTVLPSSPPESFGLVLVESLACGTPVVASDIPGVRTVVDEGRDGSLVKPENLQALITGLQTMLDLSQEQRKRMGLTGRRKIEARYTWQGIVEQLLNLYETLLGSP